MNSPESSLIQRAESAFRQLTISASDLNLASDQLGKYVADLDAALKKLNLGVTAWVPIRSGDSSDELDYWREDLGYAKIDGKWGISLRTVDGNYNYPDRDNVEKWLFNDAPRSLRLTAIQKLPILLEKLSEEATETTNKIRRKLAETEELAAAVKRVAEMPKSRPVAPRATEAGPKGEK